MRHRSVNSRFLGGYPIYFATQGHLYAKSGVIAADYINFPDPTVFYSMLAEHDVLFVTPFAAEVGETFATGRLFQLYTDIVIPTFSLHTLQSHISTYPNRPHGSWRATYQQLVADIDVARSASAPLVFSSPPAVATVCRSAATSTGATAARQYIMATI